jgi:DNA-directed RNA polymerase specialized sigma24 family protein
MGRNNKMTVIEKLKEYRKIKVEIRAIELDIEELQDDENIGTAPISYEERTGKTNKFNSYTENVAISLVDKIEKLQREKRAKERAVERIENALNILDNNEKEVLELKYIKGYRWNTVTFKLDRSYQQCKRIEKDALSRINMLF